MKERRKKFLKCLRNKRGFTLMEMVLTTAVVAIFFTLGASVLPGWLKSYHEMMQLNYASQMATSAIRAIETQIMFANQLSLDTDGKVLTITERTRTVEIPSKDLDNNIYIEGFTYDKRYYMGMQLEISYILKENEYCDITIKVFDKKKEKIIEKERAVPIL